MKKLLYILLILICSSIRTEAAHIVGGDMYYECLGGNNYRVYLKVYRDCYVNGPNVADYDAPAYIGVFSTIPGSKDTILNVDYTNRNNIPPEASNPCYQAPANICVEEATYTFDIVLAPVTGGYDIVYSRCCRNATIGNIYTPDEMGATYTVHIDPAANACNNSPAFNEFPPIVICAGQPLVFDHSATDPDGDVLKYEFCIPSIGGDQNDPQPIPVPGPFVSVVFSPPYSQTFPVASSPALNIDPNTGLMTGTPSTQGQYVVGVLVKEFRNGVQIGEIRRDFQFNVTLCNTNVEARIPVIDTIGADSTNTTGIYLYVCSDYNVTFTNQSINGRVWHWDFGVPGNGDTSNVFQPTYTYPDTGIYVVTLVANPGYFCADTTKVYLKIYPGYFVNYAAIERCEDEPLTFNDLSTSVYGIINSWQWNFDDGSGPVNTQNAQHQFPDGGTYDVRLIATNTNGCRDTMIKPITVYHEPEGQIATTEACLFSNMIISNTVSVPAPGSIVTYQWNFGNGSQSVGPIATTTYNAQGSYTIQLITTSDHGCVDTVQKIININPLPVVNTNADMVVCLNDPVQLLATGANTYRWTPVTGLSSSTIANPVATPPDNTLYVVTGTDTAGCTDTADVFIDVRDLPPTNAGPDDHYCHNYPPYQLNGTGGISFSWSPPTYLSDPNIPNPTLQPDSSTTYVLRSVSVDGCINYDTVFIEVQYPIRANRPIDGEICRYDSVQLVADGGKYYLWTPPTGLSDDSSANPLASPDSTTNYVVNVSNDCFEADFPLTVYVNQLPDVTASENDTIRRDDTATVIASGTLNYVWTPGGLTDSTRAEMRVSPFNTLTYTVIGTDAKGCTDTAQVEIFVKVVNLLQLPNAFTPDRNGHNDLFRIARRLNIETLLDFSIYNRWGERVFQTTDLEAGWDGTFRGEPQAVGVFVWYIRAINRDGQPINTQGNVTLVR